MLPRIALRPICSAAVCVLIAAPAPLDARSQARQTRHITLERAGTPKRHVQVYFTPDGMTPQLYGCQTRAFHKSCSRRRTRVALSRKQWRHLLSLWRKAMKPRPCKHTKRMTRRIAGWQTTRVRGLPASWDARYPAKAKVPRGPCFFRARFARTLLDLFLHR